MKVKFPDYNNCITNIPNSILKYFGNEEGRKTSSLLDSYLKKEYDINSSKEEIQQICVETGLYYDKIMEKIFYSKEDYYKEVYGNV